MVTIPVDSQLVQLRWCVCTLDVKPAWTSSCHRISRIFGCHRPYQRAIVIFFLLPSHFLYFIFYHKVSFVSPFCLLNFILATFSLHLLFFLFFFYFLVSGSSRCTVIGWLIASIFILFPRLSRSLPPHRSRISLKAYIARRNSPNGIRRSQLLVHRMVAGIGCSRVFRECKYGDCSPCNFKRNTFAAMSEGKNGKSENLTLAFFINFSSSERQYPVKW